MSIRLMQGTSGTLTAFCDCYERRGLRKEVEAFLKAKLDEWMLGSLLDIGKAKILTDLTVAPNENRKFQLFAGFSRAGHSDLSPRQAFGPKR